MLECDSGTKTHSHSLAHTYTHTHTNTHTHVRTHMYAHTYTLTHFHTYAHTLIHTYTQTHIHSCTHITHTDTQRERERETRSDKAIIWIACCFRNQRRTLYSVACSLIGVMKLPSTVWLSVTVSVCCLYASFSLICSLRFSNVGCSFLKISSKFTECTREDHCEFFPFGKMMNSFYHLYAQIWELDTWLSLVGGRGIRWTVLDILIQLTGRHENAQRSYFISVSGVRHHSSSHAILSEY